jgi:hypothetical protein
VPSTTSNFPPLGDGGFEIRSYGESDLAVGTGGDTGHGPARALYESLGYRALPGVRYLLLLDAPATGST